ncbi:MAG: hypothetical protein IPL83_07490 [Bdellovibrionales bacterium]|nr:hypothetical protein [Bdellovibrionales bacterium]
MKNSISLFLAISLFIQNSKVARASDTSDTPVTVEFTHSKMKETAEAHFKAVLLSTLFEAIQLNSSNLIQGLSQILENEGTTRRASIENWKVTFRENMDDENGIAGYKMQTLYNQFKDILKSTTKSRSRFEHRIISLAEAQNVPLKMAQTFISKLDSLCQYGVGFGSAGTKLPDFYMKSPDFSIRIDTPVYGSPQQAGYNGPQVEFGTNGSEEELAKFAALYNVNLIISLQYVTGSAMFASAGSAASGTWATFATASASQAAAAMAAAAAVALAVAVIIVTVNLYDSQQKSVKAVREQIKAFNGFATGEDGRRYFKDSCLQTRASLSDMLARMKSINDGNQSEIDRLNHIDQKIIEKFNVYTKAMIQYISKMSELVNKFKEAGSKNPEEQAIKELSNSNESVLLASAGKKLDPISLAKLIETTLLLSYRSASVLAQEKRAQLSPMLLDMNDDNLIETKNRLREMLVALKDLKLKMKHTPSWKADVDSHEEIQFLCDELDVIFLAQAELLVSSAFKENVDHSRSKLMDKKAQWNTLWLEAKSKFEDSRVVNALKKTFDYLEELQ